MVLHTTELSIYSSDVLFLQQINWVIPLQFTWGRKWFLSKGEHLRGNNDAEIYSPFFLLHHTLIDWEVRHTLLRDFDNIKDNKYQIIQSSLDHV